ncbi:MAG TPA: DUF1801 domain-containing protein [Candidatus Eremiobacteraceae bacterium]|nr:DUF1801 domain-containing protein [Candidatus Eremiobacteraceae bacterium]
MPRRSPIDAYLKTVAPPVRAQLERLRTIGRSVVPDAEESIYYGIPTLKRRGEAFLGFVAHTQHIGIYPFGWRPIAALRGRLTKYEHSKGAIRVPFDKPMPKALLVSLIRAKLKLIDGTHTVRNK